MQYTVNGLSLYGDLFPWSATSAKARGSVRTGTGPAVRQALTMSADLVPLSSEKNELYTGQPFSKEEGLLR
jgi:hypothetical protein